MNATVSARIPVELRDAVYASLGESGLTPTQLIQNAFAYYARTRTLPLEEAPVLPGRRTMLRDQAKALAESIRETTFPVDPTFFQGKSDDELLEEALREAYASLA